MGEDLNYNPLISVIMPAYNSEKFIHEAISSIINQTFRDFEFIIINDGSNDKTLEIIKSFDDPRIVLINNIENKGIVYSLNYAISLSKGKLLARMDSDDISLNKRLEIQAEVLLNDDELVLCSGNYSVFYNGKIIENIKLPEKHNEISDRMVFENQICHPLVMFKKDSFILSGGYVDSDINCEDYGLWLRMIKGGKFYNSPTVLLYYRIHSNNVSRKVSNKAYLSKSFLIKNNIQRKFSLVIGDKSDYELVKLLKEKIHSVNFQKWFIEEFLIYSLNKIGYFNTLIIIPKSFVFLSIYSIRRKFYNLYLRFNIFLY